MTSTVSRLPGRRSLTREDLLRVPDDGRRYELIDGLLIVSPAPGFAHQYAIGNLFVALHAARTHDLEVFPGPTEVVLGNHTVMQPDLVVAQRSSLTERDPLGTPALVVEVLSPGSRSYDLLLKKERLLRAGCANYWIVDPDIPAITAWALHDGAYVEVAQATDDQMLSVTEPFPITLTPSELTG